MTEASASAELAQLPEAKWRRLPARPMAEFRAGLEAMRALRDKLPKEQP